MTIFILIAYTSFFNETVGPTDITNFLKMKMVTESQTLKDAAKEFLAYKKAQKIRERTLKDYHKYIDPFIAQSSNSMDIDVLRREILE